jgi:NADH dehydrogenase
MTRSITILGGSGFVGRSIANRLIAAGYNLRIPTRDPEQVHPDIRILPETEILQADIHDPQTLKDLIAGSRCAINLVGILNEKGRDGSGFRHVHVELPRKLLAACRAQGVRRILHMSALNADPINGPSHYLRTKGEGEALLHEQTEIQVTTFRPSVIFGPGDGFFARFAGLLAIAPGIFPLPCAQARFAPVHVVDVAEAFARAIDDRVTFGRRYDLCGPREYTLAELVRYTARCRGLSRAVMPLPDLISRIQAAILDFVPGKPFSTDNYLSAQVDSVCKCSGLNALGIRPSPVEAIVPRYLRT